VLGETYGLLVFQEQLAMLAHKLGKDISLDEGNLLRKVLTKKGTGKDKVKDNLYKKFVAGCAEHGLSKESPTSSGQTWSSSQAMASTYRTPYPTERCPSSVRGSVTTIQWSGWLRS
jgi:DNA polymerase III alpha subunit